DKWSPKDILSHIAGWEVEVKKQFKVFLTNPDVDDNYDIDSFNKSAVELRKYLSWDQIVTELKTAQVKLSDFLTNLTQKEIDEEKRFIEWVDVLINHYDHHIRQLKQIT
ncbi:MAG: DinB family protein, partial [Ignavibacteria bacterium]|nr:DinB family protein [Ignavibacteria bacterium]